MAMVQEAAAGPHPAQSAAVSGELLHGRFEELAAREPGRTALVYAPEPGASRLELTYAELNRRANRLARRLRELGVGPEQRVAVSVDRTPGMVVALLAILKAGGAYAPLDPAYPRDRLALLLEDAHRGLSSPVLLTRRHLAANLPEPPPGTRVLFLEDEDREGGPDENLQSGATSGNLAYLIFTSGSTGRPKAVAIGHRSAVAMVDWARGVFPPESLAGVFASTSINFDLSVFELFVPLSLGGRVILGENALALARTPAASEVTLINTVPSAMAELLRMNVVPPSVQVVNLAGEPLRGVLAERIHALGTVGHLWNLYGPSEDTTYSTYAEVLPGSGEPSIGRPLEGTSAYVLDERGRRIGEAGEPGELLLAGSGLARGYLNRPELTAERFVPDPFSTVPGERAYRTGDLVRWRPDGELDYLGRIDHQVKIRGFRIELGEIEAALVSHPAVRDTAVVAREDTPGEKRLVAYVVSEGEAATQGDLLDFLAERLPDPMLPAAFVFLDDMPLNPNGKIDRGALARIEPTYDRQHGREYVAPQDPVQSALAAIWAEALGTERVGVEDPFLEVGGHSLVGTRILLKVREVFGVEVPLRVLFEASTIKALAARIESGEPSAALPPIPRLERTGPVPQSYAQERLWFLSQMLENQAVYHMPYAVRFDGDLDEAALERALQEIVRRHEVLRTVFRQTDEGALQTVLRFEPAPLTRIDLARDDFARHAADEASRPFDLEHGPVFRYELVRLAPDEHVLLLNLHHIVGDGWSMDVMARELVALYLRGWGEELPELPIQYADFSVWHRGWLESGVVERQVAWWRETLDGVPKLLELPLDRPRPQLQSFRGTRIRVELPRDLDRPLRDLSARRGATPFMTLVAAFQALLHRYTGQEDMLIGTPIANRLRPEVEPLIGFFTNTLVLRGRPSEEIPFEALLEQARSMALGAYTHQDLPFDKLVEELRIERSLSHNTLAQAAVTIQVPLPRFSLPGLEVRMEERHPGATPFDLFLALFEEETGLAGFLEYATDLFDAATVERLAGQLANLLRGACARPELPIADLPLIGEAEREQLVSGWNATATDYPRYALIHEMFEEQVRRSPDAEAMRSASGSMTYAELDARAEVLAGRLRSAGIGPDRLVCVFLERSPEQIVALLATLKAGGAYVPLDPSLPADRIAFVIADTAPVVVTRGDLRGRLPEGTSILTMEEDGPGLSHGPRPDSENLAFVLFTSGSTGRPKGVAVTHRNVARLLKENWFADFQPGDVVLQFAPLAFDASTLEIWGPLLIGGTVVMPPPHALSLDELGDAFLREKVTVMWLTAGLFHQLVEARPDSFRGLRFLMAGGDVLSPPHVDRVLRENPGLVLMNGYGPTESTTFTTGHLMTSPPGADAAVPIGRPISNTRVYLLDRGLRLVPAGGLGELCIGGDGLARGYLNRPDLTAERFVPDPLGPPGGRLYRTGDLARYRPTGEIEFLGRIDQQVKIRGFRIEPGEIETTLCEHPAVAEASVVVQGEGSDKHLVAFLVGAETDLRPFLEKRLPAYMVPSGFAWLEALPLNANGKVDRRVLAQTALRDERPGDLIEPRTPTEELVAGILAELLKRDRIGVDDDFFDLGGHSLLATRLISRLSNELGVQLSLRTVFEAPTVAGLAAALDSLLADERGIALPPILPRPRTGEDLPLSFAQERLWFLYQLDPASPLYNISLAVRLTGRLSVPALRAALQEIVRRHEVLRTAYATENGRAVQRVQAETAVTLPVSDLRGLPESLREAEAVRLAKEEEGLPYRLEEGRVTRFRLLRLDDRAWVLTLSVHHIASDGWSTSVLLGELADLYGRIVDPGDGREPVLPPLPVQYGDVAVWQRAWLQGEALDRLLAWWREALAGAPEKIELPTDRPQPAVVSHRGATRELTLPAAVLERAQALSRRLGATLFMTLLACFETVLHRVSGQDDLLVGTPVAGRGRPETEPLIGCFINTLVLRSREGPGTFRDLVRRVRTVALGAYVHQDLPFEKLVESLQVARSLDRNPLFQVMFGLHNAPLEEPALPGLALSLLDRDSDVSLFDVTLGLGEFRGELLGGFQYSADLFDPSTIERWSEHFRVILEAVMDDPDRQVSDLPRIPEPERRQVLGGEPAEVSAAAASAEDESQRKEEELRNRVAAREGELSERRSGLSDQKRAALAKLMKAKSAKLQAADEAPRLTIPRRVSAGPARLSFGQERLWFLDRLQPGTSLYNVTIALRLDGRLDLDAFQRSLDEVVRRNEVLRTVFPEIDGNPKQVVHPPSPLKLRQADLRHVPGDRQLAAVRDLVEQHDRTSFDLAHGPVVRGVLAHLAEDSWALILTFHHIVCDGLSFNVLVRELGALYNAFSQGRPSPLPDLPVQYADYAEWQRERLQGEGLAGRLDWWKRELDGAPTKLELPTDRPRPPAPTNRGASAWLSFPAGIGNAVTALRQKEGATSFMLLLAAFQALLGRYTGQDDLLVGSPVADRPLPETEALIGFFVNTLVLRGRLSGPPSFRGLLARTRESVLGAFAHQDLPFEKLVDEMGEGRDLVRTPLFQVSFSVQTAAGPSGALELPGLTLAPIDFEVTAAKFELSVALEERPAGEIVAGIQFDIDLFEPATAERLLRHYAILLEGALADPDRSLEDLPLLAEEERRQLLEDWAGVSLPVEDVRVHRLIEQQAARNPDALAVVQGDSRLSYGELDRGADRLAARLREMGAGPEKVVAVCLERSPTQVLAVLAVLKAGGAYLPLDPSNPAERLLYTLRDSGALAVLTSQELAGELEPAGVPALCLDALDLEEGDRIQVAVEPENLAYVIYTSGSTGNPKGTELRHSGLSNLVSWHRRAYGLTPDDRCALLAGSGFDASVWEIWPALASGASLHVPPADIVASPPDLWAWMAEEGITITFLPTPLVEAVLTEPVPERLVLRTILTGGDRLLRRPRREHPFDLVNHYGPTESTVVTNAAVVLREGDRPPTIGRSIENIRVFVLDRAFRPVPVGVPGELCIAGAGLARGYRHRPELTAVSFVPNPFGTPGERLYRTGDLVRWLPDGDVEFLGRIDHQIKIRGFRIELGEIEAALVALPEIREAVVLVDQEGGEKHLVAYLTPREGQSLPALHALRETLAARLPPYMVPSAFIALDAMPLNASGKVDRRALARIKPEPQAEETGAVHLTSTEEMLAGIWSELLGIERIRPSDDFFDLGGHSLLATRLVSRLREAFGVELPLRAVFQTPRLDALARRVEAALRDAGGVAAPPILPLSAEERGPWPPLSFAQERLWFLDRLEPGGVLYNVPSALRATGRLDVAALAAALNEIVRRHEALRTTFDQHEGRPFQAVAPELHVPVPVVDLTALPGDRREAEARLALSSEAAQPFDLHRGPLLRALLVRNGDEDWAMLLNMHHIVSDGWSVGVLTAEMAALYRAFLDGRPSALPPLPVQYADFAVWQRQWLRGEVLEAQIAYWRERLQGVRTVLDLPTDHPRPPVQSFRGGHRPMRLPAPVPQALREVARDSGATLFMVLLAGLQAILHRYTGQEDILVGSPVANRTRSEVEGLIGFFVNALVLRGEFRSPAPQGITFRELLGRVRTAALGAYAHQDLPFERLVDELKIERSLARNPVYQVVFTFNTPAQPLELPGLVLSPLGAEGASAKVDLLLGITEPEIGRSDTLDGSWEYSADLFDPSTIDRLSDHMAILLGAAAGNPDRPLSELPLLTASERDQILVQWNDTATSDFDIADCCLHHLFEEQAKRRPEAPAVIFDDRTMTYGELDERSERLAGRLRSLGVGPEGLVGISLERGIERIMAVLGVFKAGGAYIPLDPSHPRERLSWMLEDSRARVLIIESRLLDALPDHDAETLCLDLDDWEIEPRISAGAGVGPDHLAYVIYTSGSTGRPNGVLVRHGSAVNLIRRAVEHFGVGPESRLLQSVSFSFDASVLETWTALSTGAALCVARQETLLSGDALAAMIRRDGITTAVLTPSVLNSLPQEGMPTLEVVSVGGESCPGELASRWSPPDSILRRLLNCYGPTETTIYTTVHVCSGVYRKEPPIGRPVGGSRAYVLDFQGQPAPVGVPGALWIGGAGLARGYLNRPELTAERFAPDPFALAEHPGERLYRTGDLARWNADGELEFLGRIDRQIKIRGLRIELGEIEAALGTHPRLREYAVLVRDDGRGGKRLAAFVVPGPVLEGDEDLPPLAAQDLREHLRDRLPDYMVPGSFTFLEALPRTPTDKIDRDALLRLDPSADDHAGADFVEPRDVVELELVRIWQEVLGVPRVGVRDNFFEAGGHSLLAVKLMAQVQQRFGHELPLSILFQGGTVEEMAARLRAGESEEASTSLVPIQPSGSRPPLFCVHPAGGDVLCFAALARHLGPDQPFFGFQSQGLAGAEPPLTRIEDMAAHYVEEMRRQQPQGPYHLGGWSLGGVVAFEMARQLREQGEEVALLAILDSVPDLTAEAAGFQTDIDFLLDMAAYVESLWGKSLGLTRADLESLDMEAQLEVFAERLRGADFLPPGAGVEQLARILRVYKANANAAGAYEPRPYPGGLTLIRAADMPPVSEGPLSEPDLGWGRVVQSPVEVVPVPGQHLTILAEPHVGGLARELERYLSRRDESQ
ncbi:MAG TPA: amino acid adenylation domain-containing protein [Thermoanaerobaculia bacterium]|jgi:amino acid adenylation domain-containing protein|nr:amino acid adenylation domain-containing protein [Thermoanaerobaculia bacterium]